MIYVSIDGDDIGRSITRFYLDNDAVSLAKLNDQMGRTTRLISDYLESIGFSIVFCGADGVAGYTETLAVSQSDLFETISDLGKDCATFSVGVGGSLREAYIALMSAKSAGKARLHHYRDLVA